MPDIHVGWSPRLTIFVLFLVCTFASAGAQEPSHKATVMTEKGEIFEGTFRSATETEIVLESAVQPLRLRLAGVRTISFAGRVEEAPTSPKSRLVDDAFKAFSELQAVTEVGG
jgi:hypothetical protein